MEFQTEKGFRDYIEEIITNIKKLDPIDTTLILRQFYETKFGVFDHINKGTGKPLSSVALYDAEENGRTSILYSRIERYMRSNVFKYTGLNLVDFMNLTPEIVNHVYRIAEENTKRDADALADIQSTINGIK